MEQSVRSRGRYVFGSFQLDPASRSLTRDGAPVPLTPTLFDTLLHLVENAGRVVSKDELMDYVWPGRTVGQSNISQTIFTLRRALAGAGAQERLIATASGQGYRFAAPVRFDAEVAALATPVSPKSPAPAAVQPGRLPDATVLALAAAVLGVAVLGLAVALHPWRSPGAGRASSLVVLADFQNLTRDPIFDRTLGKALEIDLVQSPFVTVLSDGKVRETLVLMTRSSDERLNPTLAGEVCARNNGQAVINGSIAALGARYVLTLTATDCDGERILAAEKAQVHSRDAVIPALDTLIRHMRGKLGESKDSIRRFDVPLAQEKTASLAALKAYSEAAWLAVHGQRAESIPLLRYAVELDPNFATAYTGLSAIYYNIDQKEAAIQSITKAYKLRDAVNEREKFHIITLYDTIVTQDLNETIQTARAWADTYPQDYRSWIDLASALDSIGRYPEAVEAGRRALALNPGAEASYSDVARPLMHLGRLDEAAATCAQAVARGFSGDQTLGLMMELASARGDSAAQDREISGARGGPGERSVLILAARDAYRRGQVRRGDELYARAAELAKDQGLSDTALARRAGDLASLGLADKARDILARVPQSADPDNYLLALAQVGAPARARARLELELKASPMDTLLNNVFAPGAWAALAIRRGQPLDAVAALQPAVRYEAQDVDIPYLRARAYLAAKDGARAVQAFQEILDRPGLDPTSPLRLLARLGLARALRLQGDLAGSRRSYLAVLDVWRDADADLPVLRAAKSEYAAL